VSVSFARAVADGLRRHGVVVHFHSGWEWRGNGQTSAYAGGVMHHTGAAFDGGFDVLVNGRADLPGPLCNSNGWADGSITIIAAHPANHAGAAGGSWARPFPDTRNFNRMVWGHEIMFPGTVPMTRAQYRSALILGGVISGILGRPNPEWVRLHYETSVTGKWDFGAGRGHGVWFPGATYRRDIWPALNDGAPSPPPEEDMALSDDDIRKVAHAVWLHPVTDVIPVGNQPDAALRPPWALMRLDHALTRVEERQDSLEGKLDAILAKLSGEEGEAEAPKA
jgi:hypothetical protein